MLSDELFDLLIVDWMLPNMSGSDLVEEMRRMPRSKDVPVLMISGKAGRAEIAQAAKGGIDAFLWKPFTPAQLDEKIKEAVSKRKEKAGRQQQIIEFILGRKTTSRTETGPLIILGEPADTLELMNRRQYQEMVEYMLRAAGAISQINDRYPDLDVDYTVISSTYGIISGIKNPATRKRTKLMLFSLECKGNSTLLLRLMSINRREDFAAYLLCEQSQFAALKKEREGWKRLGAEILSWNSLTPERLTLIT